MPKLTMMLLMKNEERHFLREMLDSASKYCDNFVILDDNSTDNSFEIAKSYKNVEIIKKTIGESFIQNESRPRYELFNLTMQTNPEYIIALDADEILDQNGERNIRELIRSNATYDWFSFEFNHFWWDTKHVRMDGYWNPPKGPRMFRYDKNVNYNWRNTILHCGSIPQEVLQKQGTYSGFRIKHYGYAKSPAEIKAKQDFYLEKDPQGKLCFMSHYLSMTDKNPVLKEWRE